jgi:hypothetical protein
MLPQAERRLRAALRKSCHLLDGCILSNRVETAPASRASIGVT